MTRDRHSSGWHSGIRPRGGEVFFFGVLVVLLGAGNLHAQAPDTVLTLAGAHTLLRQQSPEYQAALASANAVGEGVWDAWGSLLPAVTAGVNFGRNEFTTRTFVDPTGVSQRLDNPVTSVTKTAWQGLTFNWSVFEGGSQFFDIGVNNARARAADLAAVATLVRLESDIESQYYEALKQQELTRLARDLLAARRRDLQITQARFRIAAVTQSDVLQSEINVGRQELAVLQARRSADAARRELSVMLGIEEEIGYELRDTAVIFDPSPFDLGALVSAALSSHPELARLDAEVNAWSKGLWSARGTWLPRVDLALAISRSQVVGADESLFDLGPENDGNDLRISFSWPLLAGFEKKTRTGEASARLVEARHNRVDGMLQIDRNVRNAYELLSAGYQAVQLQSRNVTLAREAVRLTTERYRIGAASFLELQQATSQATEAERGLIESRYDFMRSFAQLQGSVGRPIGIPR